MRSVFPDEGAAAARPAPDHVGVGANLFDRPDAGLWASASTSNGALAPSPAGRGPVPGQPAARAGGAAATAIMTWAGVGSGGSRRLARAMVTQQCPQSSNPPMTRPAPAPLRDVDHIAPGEAPAHNFASCG